MTKSDAAMAMLVDASVLVAIFSDESRSTIVRQRWDAVPLKYTTPFCYFEAMNIFKAKWKFQGRLDQNSYRKACTSLSAWFGGASRAGWVKDRDFLEPTHFQRVRALVDRTSLDFSDAFQIDSIKFGYFSVLSCNSRVILATTDAELARVARLEKIRVWNIELEDAPEP